MNEETIAAVASYLEGMFIGEDEDLAQALAASDAAGLPTIQVSAMQGKFLSLLARLSGAQRVLEIGTLGGYSTIWLARALPAGGRLISLEYDPKHAAVARENVARAGFGDQVEIREGRALDSLARLAEEDAGPFDFIFIDADKEPYAEYLEWSIRLARPGSVIVADNVVRKGAVLEADSDNETTQGIRRFNAALAADSRVSATVLQLVGPKGYDGMALAVVL